MSEQLGWGQSERRSCGEVRNGAKAGELSTWSSDALGSRQDPEQAVVPGGARGAGSSEGLLTALQSPQGLCHTQCCTAPPGWGYTQCCTAPPGWAVSSLP